jgi:hypothetical protein
VRVGGGAVFPADSALSALFPVDSLRPRLIGGGPVDVVLVG